MAKRKPLTVLSFLDDSTTGEVLPVSDADGNLIMDKDKWAHIVNDIFMPRYAKMIEEELARDPSRAFLYFEMEDAPDGGDHQEHQIEKNLLMPL